MTEKEIKFKTLTLLYKLDRENWHLNIAKSTTNIDDVAQLNLITQENAWFVPLSISEDGDTFYYSFNLQRNLKHWQQIKELPRHEKLRLILNVSKLFKLENRRTSFFIHPENIVFDDNLMPQIIYRGIKEYVEPFTMSHTDLVKQFKCYILALFNKNLTFDHLYNGSLEKADETEFQKNIVKLSSLEELIDYIKKSYELEKNKAIENTMNVETKKFKLFKYTSISVGVITVLLLIPVIYLFFIKAPYQEKLLEAHRGFLANDYSTVIDELDDEKVDQLPHAAKYILAYSYVKVESLNDREKDNIMKNISLRSDDDYLLYWIYNGLGDFDESLDVAKFLDDPQLIIYGLIKKLEEVKNDPNLSGNERDEQARDLQSELKEYKEEYELEDGVDNDSLDGRTLEESLTPNEETEKEADDEKEANLPTGKQKQKDKK